MSVSNAYISGLEIWFGGRASFRINVHVAHGQQHVFLNTIYQQRLKCSTHVHNGVGTKSAVGNYSTAACAMGAN